MEKKEEVVKRSIGKEIGVLSRSANKFLRHQFREYEIGHAQLMTLHYICRNNGLSQNELVQYSNLDKSSVTSQLNKLEKNGYIQRKINKDDSRGRRIFITDKTKKMEKTFHEKFVSWNKILTEGLDNEDFKTAFLLLDKLKLNAQAAIEEICNNEE